MPKDRSNLNIAVDNTPDTTSKEAVDKLKDNLYGLANEYTEKIRKLTIKGIEGVAQKVESVRSYIFDQAVTINKHIVKMTQEKMAATNDPVEKAKIMKAFEEMLKRRYEVVKSSLLDGPKKKYDDIARFADIYKATTEIAKNEKLTKIYESVCRGTPLNEEELSYTVKLFADSKIAAQVEKDAGNEDVAKKYMQMGLGTILYKMKFEQKIKFASSFSRQQGFDEFNKLGESMIVCGSITPNDYQELLSRLLAEGMPATENGKVTAQLAKFKDPKYVAEITEMAAAARKIYEKEAKDMKSDFNENAFITAMSGSNVASVVGTVWGVTTAFFNVMAAYSSGATWGDKFQNLASSGYFWASAGTLTMIASEGSTKVAAEKFTPESRPAERKVVKETSTLSLLDQHDNYPRLASWLSEGGMGVVSAYHKHLKTKQLKSQRGVDANSAEGKRQMYDINPSLISADALISFLESDYNKNLPDKVKLTNELKGLKDDTNYQTRLDKMLNDTLKFSLKARIYDQQQYGLLLLDYKKNRQKYRQLS